MRLEEWAAVRFGLPYGTSLIALAESDDGVRHHHHYDISHNAPDSKVMMVPDPIVTFHSSV